METDQEIQEVESERDALVNEDIYNVKLDVFEGPLDLLLHLIKEEELDIYNIPIARVTEQYLGYLDMMKALNLDIAGEFLVMAATLAHIKSKLLIPPEENQDDPEEEGKDPREELVRRLLEYQKYKNAAEQLFQRPLLGRDVFTRQRASKAIPPSDEPAELVEVSVFKLVESFHRVLEDFHFDDAHEVSMEHFRVSDCVNKIVNLLKKSDEGNIDFEGVLKEVRHRQEVVTMFLAVLDMLKRGMVRVFQAENFSSLQLMGTSAIYGDLDYDGRSDFDETDRGSEDKPGAESSDAGNGSLGAKTGSSEDNIGDSGSDGDRADEAKTAS